MKFQDNLQVAEWFRQVESRHYLARFDACNKLLEYHKISEPIDKLRRIFPLIVTDLNTPTELEQKNFAEASKRLRQLFEKVGRTEDFSKIEPNELNELLLDESFVKKPNLHRMQKLIDAGADVRAIDPHYQLTPFLFASKQGDFEVIRFFVELGENINQAYPKTGSTVWLRIASYLTDQTFDYLIDQGADVNAREDWGQSILMKLCEYSQRFYQVKRLVELGAHLHAQNMHGENALLCCLKRSEDLDVAQLLLEKGIDPNLSDKEGNLPLTVSVRNENEVLVKLLLDHDSDPHLSPPNSNSPYQTALNLGYLELAIEMNGEQALEDYQNLPTTPLILKLKQEILAALKTGKKFQSSNREGVGELVYKDHKFTFTYKDHSSLYQYESGFDTEQEVLDYLYRKRKFSPFNKTELAVYKDVMSLLV